MQDNGLPKIIMNNKPTGKKETADVQGQDGEIKFIFGDRNRLESQTKMFQTIQDTQNMCQEWVV
jgi:hypothetical protein